MAGHAGTVPMLLRRDALAGAAECIVEIEQFCRTDQDGLVGTVGYIDAKPGATNVIPGRCPSPSISARRSIAHRKLAVTDIVRRIEDYRQAPQAGAAARRHPREPHRALCAVAAGMSEAVAAEGFRAFELPSGAGHDGMAMIDVADVAMLFVRCRGGISHHPDEHVELADADAGARVLLRLIENFRPLGGGGRCRWEIEMDDRTVQAALRRHWDASDASDFEVEHEIYREDAVLYYPQSGERIRGPA